MPLALSTISPSKKLDPSAETASRNLSEPKRPSSALVDEPGLQGQPEIVAGGLLVHGVEEIAGPALGHGLRGPERRVELGRERVARIRGGADAEQRQVLQHRRQRRGPGRPVEDQQQALVLDPRPPAGPRHEPHPGAVDPVGDAAVPAGPVAGGARGDDVAVAVGRAARRRGQVAVEHGELHQPVEQPQRLVVGDVLLRLAREQVRQQEVGAGVGHGCSQNWRVTGFGAPRPTRAESWKMRTSSVSPGPSSAPQSAVCWAAV